MKYFGITIQVINLKQLVVVKSHLLIITRTIMDSLFEIINNHFYCIYKRCINQKVLMWKRDTYALFRNFVI